MPRLNWPAVLEQAREIAESYVSRVTLQQAFYRPVGPPRPQAI
jgi:hypothetical protein